MNPSIAQPAPPKMMPNAPVKTELIQNIPVKVPVNHGALSAHNPIATPAAPPRHDKALDIVLKDVTHAVKSPQRTAPQFAPPAKLKKARTGTAVPIVMAIIAACALSAAAYFSFGGSGSDLPGFSTFGG